MAGARLRRQKMTGRGCLFDTMNATDIFFMLKGIAAFSLVALLSFRQGKREGFDEGHDQGWKDRALIADLDARDSHGRLLHRRKGAK